MGDLPDIEPLAAALGIPLEAAWLPTIRQNLAVSLRLAAELADFALADDAHPGPVFTP